MSRTYRLRHLPPMRSWKFVDAPIHRKRFSVEKELERFVRSIGYDRYSSFHVEWELSRRDPRWFTPVGSVADHPWIPWWWVSGSAKGYYRRRGNQWARRRTKSIICTEKNLLDEDWTGHWPARRERLNKYDLD